MSTSVARLMPSISEWRQPYLLSNLDLVTESLTLIAGNSSVPALCISYRRCTPVVVSSVTPLMPSATRVQRWPSSASERRSTSRMTPYSSESVSAVDGTAPARLELLALVDQQRGVAAIVEDHVGSAAIGPQQHLLGAPPVLRQRLALPGVHRHAGRRVDRPVGPTAIAAAAWSWVEKMLHDAQRTCAPSATSVSISTAVWMVMCSDPVIRAPRSG